MKILITTSSFGDYDKTPLGLLNNEGFEVALNPFKKTLTKEQAIQLYADADAVIAGTETIDHDVLSAAKKLKVISRCGSGIDNVDREFAAQKGIKLLATLDAPVIAVAELTIGLIISLLRKIPNSDRQIRAGNWKKDMGNLLFNKTVGILGMGRIGKKTALLLQCLGAKIIYFDPYLKNEIKEYKRCSSLEEILGSADILCLHLSFNQENKNIIGRKELAMMKKSALLINASRGGLIDEKALFAALSNRELAGAALDVFEKEPYSGDLAKLDNVVLTAHIGSYAQESRVAMEIEAAENLIKALKENSS